MKKFAWMCLSLLSLLSLNAFAQGPSIGLDNLTVINLKDIQDNEVRFTTSYPGRISGNCKLIIRSRYNSSLAPFLDKFNFAVVASDPPDNSVPGALVFKLASGSYIGSFTMSSKNGRSIAENVASVLGQEDEAGVFVGVCSKLPPH